MKNKTDETAADFRYQLVNAHGEVMETVFADTLDDAAKKLGCKITSSFYGFAILESEKGHNWTVRWQSVKSINEHAALLAMAEANWKIICNHDGICTGSAGTFTRCVCDFCKIIRPLCINLAAAREVKAVQS